jgi:outer membrane immunogenic protein
MRSTAVAALALMVSTGTLAFADGMPSYYGGPAPFTWAGFYVGVNGGYGWNDSDSRDIVLQSTNGTTAATRGLTPSGGFGGGQLGYNWQRGQLVVGVEADLQAADIRDEFSSRVIDAGGDVLDAHQRLDYFGTVRGRVGFAFGRALVYATGGYAYGGGSDQLFASNGAFTANLHNDDTRSGSVVGGGVELALAPHWSAKIEYQHIDLGSERLSAPSVPPGVIITSNKLEDQVETVRLGLNYRFDSDRYYAPLK